MAKPQDFLCSFLAGKTVWIAKWLKNHQWMLEKKGWRCMGVKVLVRPKRIDFKVGQSFSLAHNIMYRDTGPLLLQEVKMGENMEAKMLLQNCPSV